MVVLSCCILPISFTKKKYLSHLTLFYPIVQCFRWCQTYVAKKQLYGITFTEVHIKHRVHMVVWAVWFFTAPWLRKQPWLSSALQSVRFPGDCQIQKWQQAESQIPGRSRLAQLSPLPRTLMIMMSSNTLRPPLTPEILTDPALEARGSQKAGSQQQHLKRQVVAKKRLSD